LTLFYLTTADTELLALSRAVQGLGDDFPVVRAANPVALDPAAAEALLAEIEASARVVIVRLLGGRGVWEQGFDRIAAACRTRGAPFVALPGDQQPDLDLAAQTTAPAEVAARVFEYLVHGGVENLREMLRFVAGACLGLDERSEPPRPLPWHGLYHPELGEPDLASYLRQRVNPDMPTVALLFYRAHWMSGNLGAFDALIRAIESRGANVLPVFCYSLKDEAAESGGTPAVFRELLLDERGEARFDCLINTLSFSMGKVSVQGPTVAGGWSVDFLDRLDRPILQAVLATSTTDAWQASSGGLSPVDTAMNVAMPEFDGRIITVPVSFKETVDRDERLGTRLVRYAPKADRVDFLARLAVNWARLRRTPNAEKRIAIMLASYPTKNARIGNAVGLDTPASVVALLRTLQAAGYHVENIPPDGDSLIHSLIDTCTYDREFLTDEQVERAAGQVSAAEYARVFDGFPNSVRAGLREAWGDPPGQVYNHPSASGQARLMVPGLRFGNVFVGIQPPRGFGDNPIAIYHSPDLAPTHHYLAVYAWLRDVFGAHAVVHMGKHGTL
jgi:cobaltochelatase CobN